MESKRDDSQSGSGAAASSAAAAPPNSLVALAYSAVLLAFYVAIWNRLLENPVKAMGETVPILVAIQVTYAVIGAYASNGSGSGVTSGSSGANGPNGSKKLLRKKRAKESESLGSAISSALIAAVLSLIMSVLVFGLVVLFGAPITTYVPETFLCAVHISVLSVQPLVFVYNLDSRLWQDIISVKLPLNGVYGASVGTWFGAWLGAIPIPLDWDRPWQAWPLTILTGAYLGTVLGTVVGVIVNKIRS